jgi:hypothetical protein
MMNFYCFFHEWPTALFLWVLLVIFSNEDTAAHR